MGGESSKESNPDKDSKSGGFLCSSNKQNRNLDKKRRNKNLSKSELMTAEYEDVVR